jgi:hypothetical protein
MPTPVKLDTHLLDDFESREFQSFVNTSTGVKGQHVYLTAFKPNDGRPAFNTVSVHAVTSVRMSSDGKRITIIHNNGIQTEVDLYPAAGGMSINRGVAS